MFLVTGEQVSGFFLLFISLLAFNVKFRSVLIKLHELGEIELGLLEKLNFSYDNVLEGEDFAGVLNDLFANLISSPILILLLKNYHCLEIAAYNFLVSSLKVDFCTSLIMISIIFLRMSFCWEFLA